MAYAASTRPGGSFRTDVGNPAMAAGAAGPGGMDMRALMEMARRRAEQKMRLEDKRAALEERTLRLQEKALKGGSRTTRAPKLSLAEQNRMHAENAAATEGARTAAATARAARGTGPRSYIKGLGYIGGPDQFTPNFSKMTGIEKSIFAPKESAFSGPSLSEMDAVGRQNSLEDMSRMSAEARGLADRGGVPTQYGQEQGQPGIAEAARQAQIMRQFPGLAQRMFGTAPQS